MIAAVSNDGIIGINNEMPWKIKEDLEFYKATTLNNYVIIGRKTYESLPNVAKLGRKYLVVGKNKVIDGTPPHKQFNDFSELINYLNELNDGNIDKIYIAGGGQIYEYFIEMCDEVLLTRINIEYNNTNENKTFFPVSRLLNLFNRYELELRKTENGTYYSFEKYKQYELFKEKKCR